MLGCRLISSGILIPIVTAMVFLLSPIEFSVIMLIICMLAGWEWGECNNFSYHLKYIFLAVLFSTLLTIIQFSLFNCYSNIHQLIVMSFLWISLGWWVIALLLILFYPTSSLIWQYSKILRLVLGLLIIDPFFYGMLFLRTLHYDENHNYGAILLLYVMVLIWVADSAAYIFGKLFGKHKFFPKISPKKTWQGFIGGLITAAIIPWIYNLWIDLGITPYRLFIFSILSELASVLGDLTESMFKRVAKIKDSGHLIPGHGGLLDRIDSLTAAVPIFTCLLLLKFR